MSFFKRLFGKEKKKQSKYVDKHGIYFYAKCGNCGDFVRVRADKQHDLQRDGKGFVWHKTIVDSKCFQRMEAVVHLDNNYLVTKQTLSNGQFVSEDAYKAAIRPAPQPEPEPEPDDEGGSAGYG